MKSVKIPGLPSGNQNNGKLKITIKVGKNGFVRTEVLSVWEVGDEVWVDNEAVGVVFERMTAPKTKISVSL